MQELTICVVDFEPERENGGRNGSLIYALVVGNVAAVLPDFQMHEKIRIHCLIDWFYVCKLLIHCMTINFRKTRLLKTISQNFLTAP